MILKRPQRGTTNGALGLVNSSSEKSMRPCFERPLILKDILSCLLMCERPSHGASPIQSSFESEVNASSFSRSFMDGETPRSGNTGHSVPVSACHTFMHEQWFAVPFLILAPRQLLSPSNACCRKAGALRLKSGWPGWRMASSMAAAVRWRCLPRQRACCSQLIVIVQPAQQMAHDQTEIPDPLLTRNRVVSKDIRRPLRTKNSSPSQSKNLATTTSARDFLFETPLLGQEPH